jgi:hypothetical protein
LEQERPLTEAITLQQGKIPIIVELAFSRGLVPRIAIMVEILGVRHHNVLAQ